MKHWRFLTNEEMKFWDYVVLIVVCFFVAFFLAALIKVFVPRNADAAALSFSFNQYMPLSESIENTRGFQFEFGDSFKGGLSYEEGRTFFSGQEAFDLEILGLYIVKDFQFDALSFGVGAGYYEPEFSKRGPFREAMWLEINHIYPEGIHGWCAKDTFTYNIHGNFGGFIRAGYRYEITKHLFIGFDAGYRFLKLRETLLRDHRAYSPNSWVEFSRVQDLSGGFVGVRVQVTW